MIAKSLGGALYFATFIDDHSRKVRVFLLEKKDQVLEAFKEFNAAVDRETGQKLKSVRADNGGEYHGPFESYYKAPWDQTGENSTKNASAKWLS